MELQYNEFYALHKRQNQEIRSLTYKNIGIQPGGRVVLTIDRKSTYKGSIPCWSVMRH